MSDTIKSKFPQQEILDRAEAFAVEKGFTVVSRTRASVVFERVGGPSLGISCALMALFIVPGLIYYAFASGKRFKTTLTAVSESKGSRVSYSSEDWFSRAYMSEFLESLETGYGVEKSSPKPPYSGNLSGGLFDTRSR